MHLMVRIEKVNPFVYHRSSIKLLRLSKQPPGFKVDNESADNKIVNRAGINLGIESLGQLKILF